MTTTVAESMNGTGLRRSPKSWVDHGDRMAATSALPSRADRRGLRGASICLIHGRTSFAGQILAFPMRPPRFLVGFIWEWNHRANPCCGHRDRCTEAFLVRSAQIRDRTNRDGW